MSFKQFLVASGSNVDTFMIQGQMLTLVEYALLLYRALLPTPVWYRFFLNKTYGSLFSSLTTGLYLTFKLTSIVEKVSQLQVATYFSIFRIFILPTNERFSLLLIGSIFLCCYKGIIQKGNPLWIVCNVRTGTSYCWHFCRPKYNNSCWIPSHLIILCIRNLKLSLQWHPSISFFCKKKCILSLHLLIIFTLGNCSR